MQDYLRAKIARQEREQATRPASKSDPERVGTVLKMFLHGASFREITAAVANAWPDADPERLIDAMLGELRRAAHADPNMILGFCLESTRQIYRKLIEAGDHKGALMALRQLADLSKKRGK